eukprot:TRINITY_DN119_c1_g1_i5.p1 TRINITY_DN119_c1_g1~~TRINITY_DN119_c1_g1_i5.p1  ORF type:complete len:200 (-),score=86.46 TRINITY_DN119_c1_g1_i5:562-1161(-)
MAGNILVLLGNPVWLVKTRLQLQTRDNTQRLGRRPYRGFTDALVTIAREEGALALYKGIVPAMLLSTQGALQFTAYEWLKGWVPRDLQQSKPVESLVMGGGSKIFASVVTYPTQVIKTRLQDRAAAFFFNDTATTEIYTGTAQCAALIWKQEGARGFFRGCVPYALRAAPASSVTFVVYEEAMRLQRGGGGGDGSGGWG